VLLISNLNVEQQYMYIQIIDLNSLLQEKDREILLKDSKYVIMRNNTVVKTVLRDLKDKEKVVI
jgi:hypothetical protein